MLQFLKGNEKTSTRLLNHLNCHAITDFIIKLINAEETPDGQGTLEVRIFDLVVTG
jgi:hypothetical protein